MCSFGCVFFKQKTAYEMRISDWSSDVCSSDLGQNFLQAIRLLGRALLAQAKPDTVKRCRKPVFLHRLHQIIDRMGIERLQRIIAIGGDEDEQRRFYFHQALDNGKSVETRHLYVEEHEIGLMRLDPPDRFPAVDAGRDDFDVRMRIKPQGKALDGQGFVVDKNCSDRHAVGSFASSRWNGMSITTSVPPEAFVLSSNL